MAEFVEVVNQWKRICKNFKNCSDGCPLSKHSGESLCSTMCDYPVEEQDEIAMRFEEVVMNWAQNHPVETNAMKLEEVFGVEFSDNAQCCELIQCPNGVGCDECQYKDFWSQEYKESEV